MRLGAPRLERTTFQTSRLLDFLSPKELIAQTGHRQAAWPLVALKELMDNALDACEDAGISPEVTVTVDKRGIAIADNGPGLPARTIKGVLDFAVRVSNREAYVSPTRGAQGNALKTIIAMPYCLQESEDGQQGRVEILAQGIRHEIICQPDRIRQKPEVTHEKYPAPDVKIGTVVRLHWPDSACSLLERAKRHFLQIADAYLLLNPHLTLTVDWLGEVHRTEATAPDWTKWLPSDPTCPHWYKLEHLERLIAAYIAHDADRKGRKAERTVRELVAQFRGLSGTAKQKAVLEATGMTRRPLSALVKNRNLDRKVIARLLAAMQKHSKPVKPAALGMIGRDHLARRFEALGCDMNIFNYSKKAGEENGVPFVIETAFAMRTREKEREGRLLVAGVNWSPGILNPFRELGHLGRSLDEVLEEKRVSRGDPVVLVLHVACPQVAYTDRGKSAIVVEGEAEDLEWELEAEETEIETAEGAE